MYFIAPLIVTVVTAVLISSRLSPNIYEQFVAQQPHLAAAFLPQLPRWAARGKVRDIMQTKIAALPELASLSAINALLLSYPTDQSFPVVSSDRFLLGSIRREKLEVLLLFFICHVFSIRLSLLSVCTSGVSSSPFFVTRFAAASLTTLIALVVIFACSK